MKVMLRSLVIAFALFACHSASPSTARPESRCPGDYPITPGTCAPVQPTTECHGVCGFVLRRRDCTPVLGAAIVVTTANLAAETDKTGRFEIPALAAGHYQIRVTAEHDIGLYELDATAEPLTLPAPLELTLQDQSCACGGNCPN